MSVSMSVALLLSIATFERHLPKQSGSETLTLILLRENWLIRWKKWRIVLLFGGLLYFNIIKLNPIENLIDFVIYETQITELQQGSNK